MALLEKASAAGQMSDPSSDTSSPGLVDDYKEIKSGATFTSANDPWGRRERAAAIEKQQGSYAVDYIPSGRDLQALLRQANDPDFQASGGGGGAPSDGDAP